MNDFQKTAKELLDFIEKSPTCFHAVVNIGAMLEEAGYDTQVLEFIEMEHTPKNILIRAVRRQEKREDSGISELTAALGVETTLQKLFRKDQE